MDGFDHLLNWKLKRGSHHFPGKDGGTCINEAALVAAGFQYKKIDSVHQMPECFSRPICALAMSLNDFCTDEQRQRLLPYVTRLACADTPDIEHKRALYIASHTHGVVFGIAFERGLSILDGALAIGRQADPLGPDEVQTRMEAVRDQATTPTSVQTVPFLSKVKSWLTMKEMEPMA